MLARRNPSGTFSAPLQPDPRVSPLVQIVRCLYCGQIHGVNLRCVPLQAVWRASPGG